MITSSPLPVLQPPWYKPRPPPSTITGPPRGQPRTRHLPLKHNYPSEAVESRLRPPPGLGQFPLVCSSRPSGGLSGPLTAFLGTPVRMVAPAYFFHERQQQCKSVTLLPSTSFVVCSKLPLVTGTLPRSSRSTVLRSFFTVR